MSPGCANCYMYRNSPKFGRDPSKVTLLNLDNARKRLQTYGELVFVNSNSDTFHKDIPFEVIDDWMKLFREFPDKQFQVLTKRIERAAEYFVTRNAPDNLWLGTSVENQDCVDRIDTLRYIPARIRFVSFEPLLGPIHDVDLTYIHWAITGGESGPGARPAKPEWFMEIMAHCEKYGTAFFHKQNGGTEARDGAGGDMLYGEQYHNFPKWR